MKLPMLRREILNAGSAPLSVPIQMDFWAYWWAFQLCRPSQTEKSVLLQWVTYMPEIYVVMKRRRGPR